MEIVRLQTLYKSQTFQIKIFNVMQDTKINNRYFEYDMSDRETIKIANEKQIAQIKDNILICYWKSNYSMFFLYCIALDQFNI